MFISAYFVSNTSILALSAFKLLMSAFITSKSFMFALFATNFSISASLAFKFVILAFVAFKSSIVAFLATKFSISASLAFKFFIVALIASKSFMFALSAISLSTCSISSSNLLTLIELAEGEVIFPVTVAVWSFIITVTLSPDCKSAVVVIGVNKSEPSILTYILDSYSTVVP